MLLMTFLRPSRFFAFPMPAVRVVLILVAAFLCITACSLFGDPGGATQKVTFLPVNISIRVEVAATESARQKGLMHRTHLGEKEGMLFYFDQLGYHSFYMYNTRIPLSVIFLDEDLRIVDIQNMAPCREQNADLCPTYAARAAARYALEVNQGFTEKYGVKIGDRVRIERPDGR
jgi:uncharacterized membrane protein (UPF0127 family)